MKKTLSILFAMLVVHTASAVRTEEPSGWHYARDYGDRTGTTLTNVISQIGAREARVIIDGGQWSISNNVTIPTNITIEVTENSDFNVITNFNMNFQGCPFVAEDYQCFSGNGTATGTAEFIYRWPAWGDTNQFNIGDGIPFVRNDEPVVFNYTVTFNSNMVFGAQASNNVFNATVNNSGFSNAVSAVSADASTWSEFPAIQDVNGGGNTATNFDDIVLDSGVSLKSPSVFKAHSSTNQVITNDVVTIIGFDVEEFDVGGNYNNATYTYTIPDAGKYYFRVATHINDGAAELLPSDDMNSLIYTNGVEATFSGVEAATGGDVLSVNCSAILALEEGDTVTPRIRFDRGSSGSWTLRASEANAIYFEGFYIGE